MEWGILWEEWEPQWAGSATIFRTRGAGLLITAIAIAARSKVAVLLPKKLAGRKDGKEDECNCSLHLDL